MKKIANPWNYPFLFLGGKTLHKAMVTICREETNCPGNLPAKDNLLVDIRAEDFAIECRSLPIGELEKIVEYSKSHNLILCYLVPDKTKEVWFISPESWTVSKKVNLENK